MKQLVIAIAMAFASLAPAGVDAREVPTRDFFKDPEFNTVALSPDGKHIALTVPEADRTLLAVLETDTNKIVGKWDYGQNRHIRNVIWANNERLLFRVGLKLGKFDYEVGKADLYASNIDGTKRIDIPNGSTYQIVDMTRDDPRTMLVSRSVESTYLSKLDVYTGRVSTVSTAKVDGGTFVVDHAGNPRYAFGLMKDGSQITLARNGDIWEEVHRTPRGGATLSPIGFAADNKHVYMERGDDGKPDSVVLLDPETGVEKPVSSNGAVSPTRTLWSSDGKTLLGVAYMDGMPYWDWVAPEHPETKVLAGLEKAFPNKAVSFSGMSDDGRYIAMRVFSDRDPGQLYLFDRQTGQAKFLAASMDWIKPEEMSPMKPVEITARDGLRMYGYLTVPAGSNGKNLPLIINPHGGPHGPRDNWGFNPEVQFLANRGYAVLQVNYRGSGGYGNAFERAGYRKWGTTMQDDLTDSVRWAVSEGIADPKRVCIYGASYGGYAALMSIVREPDLYKCSVGYVGVYDLDIQRRSSDTSESDFGMNYLRDVLPPTSVERQAQSPIYGVDRIKTPVMLVHGRLDRRVPIENVEKLEARMKAAGKAPEDVVIEDKEGHGFQDVDNQVNLYNRMQAFFDRHIGNKK